MSCASFDLAAMTAELRADEGVRLVAYDDGTGHAIVPGTKLVGHPTIGVGRSLDLNGISRAEADALLHSDITAYLAELGRLAWFAAIDGVRQRAIVNMRHQLGMAGLLGFRDMIAAIEAEDWPEAERAGLASRWAAQTPARAHRVMAMLRAGRTPSAWRNG